MPRGRRKKKGADGSTEPSVNQEATRNHNVGERRDALAAALKGVYELDAEIAGIIEAEVKPLREDKSAITTSLRERFNITAKVFRARYYAYRLEREAEAANDEITQDAIRELFEVCPVTGQGSFAQALDSTAPQPAKATKPVANKPPAPSPEPQAQSESPSFAEDEAPDDPEAAWQLGVDARKASPSRDEALKRCPYEPAQMTLRSRFEEGVDVEDYEQQRASGRVTAGA